MKVLVIQSCPTLCDPMNCSPPGSSVPGLLLVRILEWVAVPFPSGSFWPRDQTQVSCLAGRFFTIWATREALLDTYHSSDSLCIFRVLKYLLYREKQLLINVIKVLKLELVFIKYVQNKYAKLLQSCPTVIPWTVACQAPLSMGFSRQEYWSG